MRDAIIKGRVDSRAPGQVICVQMQVQSFNLYFEIQLGILVLRHTNNSSFTLGYTYVHVIKLSKLQIYVFHHYKAWERKLVFAHFLRKLVSKRKLEIDDPKLPKKRKVSSHYQGGEATVEFVSTIEEHYCQFFISAEILHRNSSGNE